MNIAEESQKFWPQGLVEMGLGKDANTPITKYSPVKGWYIESSEILLNQHSQKEDEGFKTGKLMH